MVHCGTCGFSVSGAAAVAQTEMARRRAWKSMVQILVDEDVLRQEVVEPVDVDAESDTDRESARAILIFPSQIRTPYAASPWRKCTTGRLAVVEPVCSHRYVRRSVELHPKFV